MSILKILNKKKELIVFVSLKLVDSFIGLFLNMLVVKKLTMTDVGIYSIVLTILGFLVTFGFSWSSSAITYFGVQEKTRTGSLRKTFWTRNYIVLLGVIVLIIIFYFFNQKIENYIGIRISKLLIIWLIVKIIIDTLYTYFIAIKKQVISALIFVIGKVSFLVVLLTINLSLRNLIIANIICDSVGIIYIFKVDKKDIGKPIWDKEKLKEVLDFGLWQLFGFSGLYLINFGDNFIIKYFLTLEDVALYNIAYKLFNSIASLSFLFSSYYASLTMEAVERRNLKQIKKVFYKDRIIISIIIFIPHILVIAFANQIIVLIYGKDYLEAAKIFQILMIGSLISHVTVFNILIFNCLKKYKVGQIINILRALMNIILDIIFIKKYGVIGAAYGTIFAIMITKIYEVYYCEKTLNNFIKES